MVVLKSLSDKRYSDLKKKLHSHVSGGGNSGRHHVTAVIGFEEEKAKITRSAQVYKHLLQICLTIVKQKSAGQHFEDLVALSDSLGSDVGSLNHSRMQMKPLLISLVGSIRIKLNQQLLKPLEFTGFPPHFGVTLDKSTTLRDTNQAIMILLVVDGVRKAIPVGSPKVYSPMGTEGNIEGGTGYDLGVQMVDTIKNFCRLTDDDITYLVGENHVIFMKLVCNCYRLDNRT